MKHTQNNNQQAVLYRLQLLISAILASTLLMPDNAIAQPKPQKEQELLELPSFSAEIVEEEPKIMELELLTTEELQSLYSNSRPDKEPSPKNEVLITPSTTETEGTTSAADNEQQTSEDINDNETAPSQTQAINNSNTTTTQQADNDNLPSDEVDNRGNSIPQDNGAEDDIITANSSTDIQNTSNKYQQQTGESTDYSTTNEHDSTDDDEHIIARKIIDAAQNIINVSQNKDKVRQDSTSNNNIKQWWDIGTIMFQKQEVELLLAAIDEYKKLAAAGITDIETGDNVTTTTDASANKTTSAQPNYKIIYVGTIMYLSPNKWSVWINGKKFSSHNNAPLEAIEVVDISNDKVTIRWTPDVKIESYEKNTNDITREEDSFLITMRSNQALLSRLLTVNEGRVIDENIRKILSSSAMDEEESANDIDNMNASSSIPDSDRVNMDKLIQQYDAAKKITNNGNK